MTSSYGAICSDFYVNQKLSLRMDLPTSRETVLDLFDRMRKDFPEMDRFRRYDGELALETPQRESEYSWIAMRRTSMRSGWVNPKSLEHAYKLHALILELAPYYLSIRPLDVQYLELLFGFDLDGAPNRHEAVFDALLADSPMASLIENDQERIIDAQPVIGFNLSSDERVQAFVEVKSRPRGETGAEWRSETEEPISVYLTVRQKGSVDDLKDFGTVFGRLAGYGERLAEERVIPSIVLPIRQAIMSG